MLLRSLLEDLHQWGLKSTLASRFGFALVLLPLRDRFGVVLCIQSWISSGCLFVESITVDIFERFGIDAAAKEPYGDCAKAVSTDTI